MPLNYDLGGIEDYKRKCYRKAKVDEFGRKTKEYSYYLKPIINCLIDATRTVGINKITEKNAEHFHRRLIELEVVTGRGFITQIEKIGKQEFHKRMPTLKEVKDHIGLWTNAFGYTKKTNREWNSYIKSFSFFDNEVDAQILKDKELAEKIAKLREEKYDIDELTNTVEY